MQTAQRSIASHLDYTMLFTSELWMPFSADVPDLTAVGDCTAIAQAQRSGIFQKFSGLCLCFDAARDHVFPCPSGNNVSFKPVLPCLCFRPDLAVALDDHTWYPEQNWPVKNEDSQPMGVNTLPPKLTNVMDGPLDVNTVPSMPVEQNVWPLDVNIVPSKPNLCNMAVDSLPPRLDASRDCRYEATYKMGMYAWPLNVNTVPFKPEDQPMDDCNGGHQSQLHQDEMADEDQWQICGLRGGASSRKKLNKQRKAAWQTSQQPVATTNKFDALGSSEVEAGGEGEGTAELSSLLEPTWAEDSLSLSESYYDELEESDDEPYIGYKEVKSNYRWCGCPVGLCSWHSCDDVSIIKPNLDEESHCTDIFDGSHHLASQTISLLHDLHTTLALSLEEEGPHMGTKDMETMGIEQPVIDDNREQHDDNLGSLDQNMHIADKVEEPTDVKLTCARSPWIVSDCGNWADETEEETYDETIHLFLEMIDESCNNDEISLRGGASQGETSIQPVNQQSVDSTATRADTPMGVTFAEMVKQWQQDDYNPDRFSWQRHRNKDLKQIEDTQDKPGNLRGGAAGASATKHKRQITEIMGELAECLAHSKDGLDPGLKKAMDALTKGLESWKTKASSKHEVLEMLQGVIKTIGKSPEDAKKNPGKLSNAQRRQTFYDAFSKGAHRNDEAKELRKPKGKGKGKQAEGLPRFDLQRSFPRSRIASYQTVLRALEKGEKPEGDATICSELQAAELQSMVAALQMDVNMMLFMKHQGTETVVKNAEEVWLPYIGNLAMVKGRVATLKGTKANYKGEQVKSIKQVHNDADGPTLRVLLCLKYVPLALRRQYTEHPESFLKTLKLEGQAVKTYKWEKSTDGITGYVTIAESLAKTLLARSGSHGIFITALSRDIIKKHEVTWIPRQDDESDAAYFARVEKQGQEAKVPLTYRRGGGTDLGIQKAGGDDNRSFAVWGVPAHIGPLQLEKLLKDEGWQLQQTPLENRHPRSPWKVIGQAPPQPWNYQLPEGKVISIVPWIANRRHKGDEAEKLCGRRWFNPTADYDPIEPTITPTVPYTAQVASTAMDTQSSAATSHDAKASQTSVPEPASKRRKAEKICSLVGGEAGPDPATHLIDCGGSGDCGWRCAAVLLALHNAGWSTNLAKLTEKQELLGQALRGQAVNHPLHSWTDWQGLWHQDEKATEVTEAGSIPTTLAEFREALNRPRRWICQLGWQAISDLKRVNIAIFERRETSGWHRISLIVPTHLDTVQKKERQMKIRKLPIVPVALSDGHYFVILRESKAYPTSWLDDLDDGKIGDAKRGGADELSIEDLLRPLDEQKVDAAESLRPSTPSKMEDIEHLLRQCTPTKQSTPLKTKQWNCPLCSYACKLDAQAGQKIYGRINKLHRDEKQRRIASSSNGFSGLGMRSLLQPIEFQQIQPQDGVAPFFLCEHCGAGLIERPGDPWLLRKSKLRHFQVCKKIPSKTSFSAFASTGQRGGRPGKPSEFTKIKKAEFNRAWFICIFCQKGLMVKPGTRFTALSAKLHHYNNCPEKPRACPNIQSYAAMGHISWRSKDKKRRLGQGHKVTCMQLKSNTKKWKGSYIFTCKACRASYPPGKREWREACRGKPKKSKQGFTPDLSWWKRFTKGHGVRQMIKQLDIKGTEAAKLKKALKKGQE